MVKQVENGHYIDPMNGNEVKLYYYANEDGSYLTEAQIVDHMLVNMGPASFKILRETPRNKLIQFHHSAGRNIRNEYGMWHKENPNINITDPLIENGVITDLMYPDQVSQRVIEAVWERINATL